MQFKLSSFTKQIVSFLVRLVMFIFSMILCLPVVLLPQATAVPIPLWILLAAADLVLLILFFSLKPNWKGMTVSVSGYLWWVYWP